VKLNGVSNQPPPPAEPHPTIDILASVMMQIHHVHECHPSVATFSTSAAFNLALSGKGDSTHMNVSRPYSVLFFRNAIRETSTHYIWDTGENETVANVEIFSNISTVDQADVYYQVFIMLNKDSFDAKSDFPCIDTTGDEKVHSVARECLEPTKHVGYTMTRVVVVANLAHGSVESVYSHVDSSQSLRIVTCLSELNHLELWTTDLGNIYLVSNTT
jgi:hypothetical protein